MEQIWSQATKELATYGIFAVLFGVMLTYVLKTNDKRETRYIDTINNLSKNLSVVDVVKTDVECIKQGVTAIQIRLGTGGNSK